MDKILVAYATLSGNTEEVAELIKVIGNESEKEVHLHRIDVDVFPKVKAYDALIIGSYTWDRGSTPDEVKDFVADVGYKPDNVYVFGTGDTQFGGDELFCNAAEKLGRFYHTRYPVLKIEQSPRGKQEEKVIKWAEGIMKNDTTNKSKSN